MNIDNLLAKYKIEPSNNLALKIIKSKNRPLSEILYEIFLEYIPKPSFSLTAFFVISFLVGFQYSYDNLTYNYLESIYE